MSMGEQDRRVETVEAEQGLSGMAVGSLVAAIAALLLTVTVEREFGPYVIALSAVALVLGIVGGRAAIRQNLSGVWFARIGVLVSAIALIVGAFWFNQ
ncbi:hypothetical protein SK224_08215 [Microbacterium sp. BG28]|uniref:hypothetical protein n=1 Tax=Microbacterium sp. BG28 TaxID=3097356 RepID=UPI002A5ACA91|nr:hypothetical protein [Microbacterium sp. BG28]MDY0829112.1 hypothetical protein [Microbacterium sp. BG28]